MRRSSNAPAWRTFSSGDCARRVGRPRTWPAPWILAALAFVPAVAAPIALHANLLIAAQLTGNAEASRGTRQVEYAKIRVSLWQAHRRLSGRWPIIVQIWFHCEPERRFRKQCLPRSPPVTHVMTHASNPAPPASLPPTLRSAMRPSPFAFMAASASQRNAMHHYLKRAHLFDHISGGTRLHQVNAAALLRRPTLNRRAAIVLSAVLRVSPASRG